MTTGDHEPLDGICGNAVCDSNGDVIAPLRFADDNGYATATSVVPLIEAGLLGFLTSAPLMTLGIMRLFFSTRLFPEDVTG